MKAGTSFTIFLQFLFVFVTVNLVLGRKHANEILVNSTRQASGIVSYITFAADNLGSLYVNGQKYQSVGHWKDVGSVSVSLFEGDVVSIQAQDKGVWYGVIADIEYNGVHYGTGSSDWKARKSFDVRMESDGKSREGWMLQNYSSCDWPVAIVRPRADVYFAGKAQDFPAGLDAKYVWASDAGQGDTIFMRFVVGGERCGTSGTVQAPAPKVTDGDKRKQEGTTTLSGQSEDSGSDVICNCRISPVSPGASPGVCWNLYYPEDTGFSEADATRCYDRECDPKFECVTNGASSTMTCMRRIATEKVVRDLSNDGHCVKIAIAPTVFYTLYDGGNDSSPQ